MTTNSDRISREALFHPEFRKDLTWWIKQDRKVALKIMNLVDAIIRDPFVGIGKPEPLKHVEAGTWSRRITKKDRLVYIVQEDRIDFLQARDHY